MPIKRNYVLTIFILWTYSVVQCNTTTSSAAVSCTPPLILCGSKSCYNPTTQSCTGSSIIECIDLCGRQCYNSANDICINGSICRIGQGLCEVKYNIYGGVLSPSQLQCYNLNSQICLNHTTCSYNDVCGRQCMPYPTTYPVARYPICVNNTICTVPLPTNNYQPNQIQLCNGSCYDTENPPVKHCVNNAVQCISNCSNTCYDAATHVCHNGTICRKGQDACLINFAVSGGYPLSQPQTVCYDPLNQVCHNGSICPKEEELCEIDFDTSYGHPLTRPQTACYSPLTHKCLNRAVCSNARICNGLCITGYNSTYQVCANDKRTLCNVTSLYNYYNHYQIHLCKGQCYDTHLSQCVDESITCIDEQCGGQCYNSASHVCIDGSLCSIGQDLCIVKYDTNGFPTTSSVAQCYNPKAQICLNHTICSPNRVCSGQCITGSNSNYQVCANDNRTLCNVSNPYNNYRPNQIQICNGQCYDTEYPPLKHCVNGTVQCISECSGRCYNAAIQVCLNGVLCNVGQNACLTDFDEYYGHAISPPQIRCYNPSSYICLNRALCRKDRTCNGQCITGPNAWYQVCANDKRTICNVTKTFDNYRENQMQLCDGFCYDSFLQQCHGQTVAPCIHDPITQICIPENINGSTTTIPALTTNTSTTSSPTLTNSSTILTNASGENIASTVLATFISNDTSSTETVFESTSNSSTSSTVTSTILVSTITMIPSENSTDSGLNSSLVTHIGQTTTNTWTSTATTSSSNSCCAVQECTEDADCCISGVECQCYHHDQTHFNGSCLNPYVTPICADGCPKKSVCLTDTDCCKCQCGNVTVTDANGNTITKKQCVSR